MALSPDFVMSGGIVALTMDEIDDAIARAIKVPEDQRGPVWDCWVDGLLDQRLRLEAGARYSPSRVTRIVHATETRA